MATAGRTLLGSLAVRWRGQRRRRVRPCAGRIATDRRWAIRRRRPAIEHGIDVQRAGRDRRATVDLVHHARGDPDRAPGRQHEARGLGRHGHHPPGRVGDLRTLVAVHRIEEARRIFVGEPHDGTRFQRIVGRFLHAAPAYVIAPANGSRRRGRSGSRPSLRGAPGSVRGSVRRTMVDLRRRPAAPLCFSAMAAARPESGFRHSSLAVGVSAPAALFWGPSARRIPPAAAADRS